MASTVAIHSFARWCDTEPQLVDRDDAEEALAERGDAPSKFPVSMQLNTKVSLGRANMWKLRGDALVHSTSESLRPRTETGLMLFEKGGPRLQAEVDATERCRTGEAVATTAGNLHAKALIHTVGPRYFEKYRTAAENALHGCYRSCLRCLREAGLRTIALPCVYAPDKGYPRKDAAHIAIRTVRRFLEAYGDSVDRVLFVVTNPEDEFIYHELLPLYFPRTPEEEAIAHVMLPEDTGNEVGETVIEDRKIRIAAIPGEGDGADGGGGGGGGDGGDPSSELTSPARLRAVAQDSFFSEMRSDPDRERAEDGSDLADGGIAPSGGVEDFDKLLESSDRVDLSSVAALQLVYRSGEDHLGRPILVFLLAHLPAHHVSFDKILMFLFRTVEDVMEVPYTAVLVNSPLSAKNTPSYPSLARVVRMLPHMYRKNMARLFIVHPNFWLKSALLFLRSVASRKVWNKVTFVTQVKDLFQFFDPAVLRLPLHVIRRDLDINSMAYTGKPSRTSGGAAAPVVSSARSPGSGPMPSGGAVPTGKASPRVGGGAGAGGGGGAGAGAGGGQGGGDDTDIL